MFTTLSAGRLDFAGQLQVRLSGMPWLQSAKPAVVHACHHYMQRTPQSLSEARQPGTAHHQGLHLLLTERLSPAQATMGLVVACGGAILGLHMYITRRFPQKHVPPQVHCLAISSGRPKFETAFNGHRRPASCRVTGSCIKASALQRHVPTNKRIS